MFDIAILDVAIGLIVVFFVFSVMVSGIYELVAKLLKLRAKTLWDGIARLVDDPPGRPDPSGRLVAAVGHGSRYGDRRPKKGDAVASTVAEKLYNHALIGAIEPAKRAARTRIDHIEANQFARALIDVVIPPREGAPTLTKVRSAIADLAAKNSPLAAPLQLLVSEVAQTEKGVEEFRDKVGAWFDAQMSTLSLAYRRRAKWWLFLIACAVTALLNIDAVFITRTLFQDDALRAAAVAQAEALAETCTNAPDPEKCVATQADEIKKSLDLPVGWDRPFDEQGGWVVVGWPLAALALAQGAPFWFDVLQRAVRYRRAIAGGKDNSD